MKKLGLILGMLLITLTVTAQEKKGVTVTVTIENVTSNDGTILGSLHTSDTFMKGPGIKNIDAPSKTGEVTLTFENVTPGTFAIMVMHDENDNKQMDKEVNGMPKESYGTTGEMNLYGPPSFESSKFEVNTTDLDLKLRF